MKLVTCVVAAGVLAGCALVTSLDDLASDAAVDVAESGGETSCGDTTSSANCGRCGHDCRTGACVSGVCQPAVLTSTSPQASPSYIDVDGPYVFWIEGGAIKRVSTTPNDGGVVQVATVPAAQLLSAQGDLRLVGQVAEGGTFEIFEALEQPSDASVAHVISASEVRSYARDQTHDYAYIRNGPCGGNTAGCIVTCDDASGPTIVQPKLAPNGNLTLDGRVFFTTDGSVESFALGEDGGTLLATTGDDLTSIAADTNGVYVTGTTSKSVMRAPRVPTDGGPAELLAGQQASPHGAVARAGLLVWISDDGLDGCDPTSCSATKRVYAAAPLFHPDYVTLDSDAIYFTDATHGAVYVVVR